MPKNEDGEFELILGNRQLLSVFFIVVILLGVFFTMGYIVGRNSTPLTQDIAAARKETKPLVVESPVPPPEPAPAASSSPPVETAAQQPPPAEAAEPAKAERLAAPPPARAAVSDEPAAGQTFLQLAATSKREADIMVDVLRQKKFKAMAAEIPERRGTFRVLVGPVGDTGVNQMRADLQEAGFPGNAAIRRTF